MTRGSEAEDPRPATFEHDTIRAVDARAGLADLPDQSVDCVLTSPPYWAVRDYSVSPSTWADGSVCSLGLEASPEQYVDHLIEVFDGVRRVLKDTGTLWVNLGDVYASGSRSRWGGPLRHHLNNPPKDAPTTGLSASNQPLPNHGPAFSKLPDKTLCLIPERFAIRMLERGWTLRNKIVWHKPNFLPSSVRDRFACSWEYLFLFSKSDRYSFDIDAVRVPHISPQRLGSGWQSRRKEVSRPRLGMRLPPKPGEPGGLYYLGKNPGDCWMIATRGGPFPHPAVFPEALCERPILAGCQVGGLVLDPFAGSGTACVVAKRLGRRYLGFEVNPAYAEKARERLRNTPAASAAPSASGEAAA